VLPQLVASESDPSVLWEFANALRVLYRLAPAAAVSAFRAVARPFAGVGESSLAQFFAAVWIDFLMIVPAVEISEFEAVLSDLIAACSRRDDPELRKLALYGVGRVYGRMDLGAQALDRLLDTIYRAVKGEDCEELFVGNDCGIGSFALLLRKRLAGGSAAAQVEHFIELFPPRVEAEEAQLAYQTLVELLPDYPKWALEIRALIESGLSSHWRDEFLEQLIESHPSARHLDARGP
jgi:hypothetical protein